MTKEEIEKIPLCEIEKKLYHVDSTLSFDELKRMIEVYVHYILMSRSNTNQLIEELQEDYGQLDKEYNQLQQENEKQKQILDILKPYFIVENLSGNYWLMVGGGNYQKWLVYEITEEQYELLKEEAK